MDAGLHVMPRAARPGPRAAGLRRLLPAVAAAAAVAVTACGGDDGPTEPPAPTGTLEVSAATTGDTLDPDGYTVTLDSAESRELPPSGSVTFSDVEEGGHDLDLSGVQVNCELGGASTVPVRVAADETTTATFNVTCGPALLDRVVFHSSRDGNGEIYAMAPDGSDVTRLTSWSTDEFEPSVSPDGRRIALRTGTTSREILVMAADGSDTLWLTDFGSHSEQPTWSPDGDRIAFASDLYDPGVPHLFVMNADGTGIEELTDDPAGEEHPAWSPDGDRIAYDAGGLFIMTINPDGSGRTALTESGSGDNRDPAWSPDGSRIAFASDRDGNWEIYVMDADGSNETRVTEAAGLDRWPTWSPDGTRILFVSDRSGQMAVRTIDPDGTGDEALTDPGTGDDLTPRRTPARP